MSPAPENSPTTSTCPGRLMLPSCAPRRRTRQSAGWTLQRRSGCQAFSPCSRAPTLRRRTSAAFLRSRLSTAATASRCTRPACRSWPATEFAMSVNPSRSWSRRRPSRRWTRPKAVEVSARPASCGLRRGVRDRVGRSGDLAGCAGQRRARLGGRRSRGGRCGFQPGGACGARQARGYAARSQLQWSRAPPSPSFDAQTQRYTLIAPTQGVAVVRKVLAEGVFNVPREPASASSPTTLAAASA